MLKQILRDMYIHPDILAGLDETQKQTLFCKMREEQIRRWRLWDQKYEQIEQSNDHKPHTPIVTFRQGEDGEPWVWVMGEHPNDLSIDDILADEVIQRARQLAEIETKEYRKSYVAEMSAAAADNNIIIGGYDSDCSQTITATPTTTQITPIKINRKITIANMNDNDNDDDQLIIINNTPKIDEMEIYCSVDELRERINNQANNNNNNNNKKPSILGPPPPPPLSLTTSNTGNTINTTSVIPSPQTTQLRSTNSFKQLQNVYGSRLANFNLTSSQPLTHSPDVLKEITTNKPAQKVSAKIALWEKRVIGEKTTEIYRRLQQKQKDAAVEAEEAARKQEELWQEQERRAKEAEVQMRDIARRAREEHRKSMNSCDDNNRNCNSANSNSSLESSTSSTSSSELLNQQNCDNGGGIGDIGRGGDGGNGNNSSSPPSSLDSSLISRPSSQDAVVKWYREIEFFKGSGIEGDTGKPYKWFHGLVTRPEAEQLLINEAAGTFLVRLSEKIWGYAISYKDNDRCKHYLIDASSKTYQFLGANQLNHDSLNELIRFHANVPITIMGQEQLLQPCLPISTVPKILDGLLTDENDE